MVAPYVAAGPVLVADGIGLLAGTCWEATERSAGFYSRKVAPALRRALIGAEDALDPLRAATGLALIGGLGLVASQFLDLRGVSIGSALYGGQVALDAPAPVTATETLGGANLWIPAALGLAAIVSAVIALRARRRKLGLAVAGIGCAALGITLAIDLPRGLDDTAARPYGSAQVLLLEGFWIQACAALLLVLAGFGIARPGRRRAPGDTAR